MLSCLSRMNPPTFLLEHNRAMSRALDSKRTVCYKRAQVQAAFMRRLLVLQRL